MVGSVTRNACAISTVVSPHTSRRVSATWASLASAGWQQVKMSRSLSSGITSSSSAWPPPGGTDPGTGASGSMSSGSFARSTRSRRLASIARRRAAVVSQAPGLRGTP